MNTLFLSFIVLFLLSLAIIYLLVYFTIKKKITLRDYAFGFIVSLVVGIFVLTGVKASEVNKTMVGDIVISKERVSEINYMDSTITDSVLYSMITQLRIPHSKIVFAQAKLESANYKSELYKSNLNLFGMKFATIRPTVTPHEYLGYQRYMNWKESVVDYLIWQFANNVDKISDDKYFEYLHKVYAEDPSYVPKLKKIIQNTNFDKLK